MHACIHASERATDTQRKKENEKKEDQILSRLLTLSLFLCRSRPFSLSLWIKQKRDERVSDSLSLALFLSLAPSFSLFLALSLALALSLKEESEKKE